MTPESRIIAAQERLRSREIDAEIEKERISLKKGRDSRVLILGSGDSGKSTFIKQLKVLHGGGYSEDERKQYRSMILENIRECVVTLLASMQALGVTITNRSTIESVQEIQEYYRVGQDQLARYKITPKMATMIHEVWQDPHVQEAYSQRGKLSQDIMVPDNTQYFLNEIIKFGDVKYIPSKEDIFNTRAMTTQITETTFRINEANCRFYDVGGQQKYRKQWTPYFDNVDSLLFIASIASYDQVLVEDPKVNRMQDAIDLFAQIVHHPLIKHIPVALFLNKKDLFEKKIPNSNVIDYFPDFKGEVGNIKQAAKYFQKRFESECTDQNKQLFVHFTCCTDTETMEVVVSTVIQAMMSREFQSIGII